MCDFLQIKCKYGVNFSKLIVGYKNYKYIQQSSCCVCVLSPEERKMNSIFTEENLLAFTMAARYRSFSKAAKELGLTTSAISYTIKRMEMGLDVVLFTRTTRSIELTEPGHYLFAKQLTCSTITTPSYVELMPSLRELNPGCAFVLINCCIPLSIQLGFCKCSGNTFQPAR